MSACSRILAAAALVAACGAPGASAPAATAVTVEAERFTEALDLGGGPIEVVDCAQASGLLAVDGLDTAGEMIALAVDAPLSGCYDVYLGFQAGFGDVVGARLSAGPGRAGGTSTIFVLPGEGIG